MRQLRRIQNRFKEGTKHLQIVGEEGAWLARPRRTWASLRPGLYSSPAFLRCTCGRSVLLEKCDSYPSVRTPLYKQTHSSRKLFCLHLISLTSQKSSRTEAPWSIVPSLVPGKKTVHAPVAQYLFSVLHCAMAGRDIAPRVIAPSRLPISKKTEKQKARSFRR